MPRAAPRERGCSCFSQRRWRNGALLQGQQRTQFRRPPEMPAVGIKRPAAHAGDALGLAQVQLLFLQQRFERFCCSISVCVPTMRRGWPSAVRDHAAAIQHPTPLAIGLAKAELCTVLLAAPMQVRRRAARTRAMSSCTRASSSVASRRPAPASASRGHWGCPSPTGCGRHCPAPVPSARHRPPAPARDAEGEGQQVACAVAPHADGRRSPRGPPGSVQATMPPSATIRRRSSSIGA